MVILVRIGPGGLRAPCVLACAMCIFFFFRVEILIYFLSFKFLNWVLNALKQILYDTTDCLLATTNMIFISEMFNINKYVETQV